MADEKLLRFKTMLRTGSPSLFRHAYRLARSAWPQPASPAMPAHLIEGCRMFATRQDLVADLPSDGVVAEVGTFKGDFARTIRQRCAPKALHLIDVDYSRFRDDELTSDTVIRHCGVSTEILSAFPDETFDWIYIDADHSYAGVRADAEAAGPKLKRGGYLVFNDFAHIDMNLGRYGVHRAAVEFAVANGWRMSHFSYDPHGLYDAAFRKPDQD